jgi:DNA-binding response OmpR family regulator
MELYAHVMERSSVAAARMMFMTGGTFTDAARVFLEAVPNPSLAKPFSIAELRKACEAFFARADAAVTDAG